MAEKSFTDKQREVVARKMGYEGPMNMFDSYLKSSPADARKYGLITETFMARGGMVKKKKVLKFVDGGDVVDQTATTTADTTVAPTTTTTPTLEERQAATPTTESIARKQAIASLYASELGRAADAPGLEFWANSGLSLEEIRNNFQGSQEGVAYFGTKAANQAAAERVREAAPDQPKAASVTAAQVAATPEQFINTQLAPAAATTATAAAPITAATAAAPVTSTAATTTTATGAGAVTGALEGIQAAQGTVGAQNIVTAEQVDPTKTALDTLKVAEGTAYQITNFPKRVLSTDEVVTGSSVDMAAVNAALSQNIAAQGVVDEQSTVSGQLNKLFRDFSTNNPPAWASGSIRNANAVLAARGLGASSVAGQAIVQAALEAAMPIAAADAAVQAQMGLANLSNRQQMAVLTGQQRAQFLGQEFDQAFQTKVLNAAKISDIANVNFSAEIQVTLENARMAQTVDLANLSNRQALVMAKAAQIANLELTNLNNRQQAAVTNAQTFLAMDLANLGNRQQTEIFKAQSTVQSILSDTAAENASRQFNASSTNQTNQFFAGLTAQVNQFNTSQVNAMSQFNVDQANAVSKFNAEAQNLRDQFNAQNRLVIDQSNAQWRRDIATANTAATNRANEFNAIKAQEITMVDYNNQWQQFRDEIEYSWKSSESAAERSNNIAVAEIKANADILIATAAKDAALTKQIGESIVSVLSGTDVAGTAKSVIKTISNLAPEIYDGITNWTSGMFNTTDYSFQDYVPPPEDYVAPNVEE